MNLKDVDVEYEKKRLNLTIGEIKKQLEKTMELVDKHK